MAAELDRICASASVPKIMSNSIQFEIVLTDLPKVSGGNRTNIGLFCSKFQDGNVDLSLIDSKVHCLLAALSYAQLSSESNDYLGAIDKFQNIYRTPQNLVDNYFTTKQQFKISKMFSLKDCCHYISRILGKNICMLHIVNKKFMVKFKSDEKFHDKLFILMSITTRKNPHIYYNYLLKNTKYKFCQICTKSFCLKLAKRHFCERDKCSRCHRYFYLCQKRTSFSCLNCKLIFFNHECFQVHKLNNCFKQKQQKKVDDRCNICYKSHEKMEYCPISINSRKFHSKDYFVLTSIPLKYELQNDIKYIKSTLCLTNMRTQICDISYDFGLTFTTKIQMHLTDSLSSIKDLVLSISNIGYNKSLQKNILCNLINHEFLHDCRIFIEDTMFSLLASQLTSCKIQRVLYLKGAPSYISLVNNIEFMRLSVITLNTYPEIICLQMGLLNAEMGSNYLDLEEVDGYTAIDKKSWKIRDLIGTDQEIYEQIEICQHAITYAKYKSIDLTIIRLLYKTLIYCKAFKLIDDFIVRLDKYMGHEGKYLDNIYSPTSLIHSRLITTIADLDVCILPVKAKQILKNTSKVEVSLALLLETFFNSHRLGSIKSCVTEDGQQCMILLPDGTYYSADIFCQEQEQLTLVSVEGTFKFNCSIHQTNQQKMIWGLTRENRTRKATSRLKLVEIYCRQNNINHVILPTCCLRDKGSNVLFDFLQTFNKNNIINISHYTDMYTKILDTFDRRKYERLNFQESVSPNYVYSGPKLTINNHLQSILRFDRKSCYPSIVISNEFRIPIGQPKRFVGMSAKNYFETMKSSSTDIGVARVICYPPSKRRIMAYLCTKINKRAVLTSCRMCSEESYEKGVTLKSCFHNAIQRSFYTTIFVSDIFYLKQFGYTFDLTELILFNSTRPTKLQNTVNFIMDNVKSSLFLKHFLKFTLLSALGRFACDGQKYKPFKILNQVDFFLYQTCSQIEDFQFIGNPNDPLCIAILKSTKQNYNTNYKSQTKYKSNSVLFANIVAMNRRQIHAHCIIISRLSDISILRVDTDSITIFTTNCLANLITKYFLSKGFSIDTKIIGIRNISLKSYYIWFTTSHVRIKCCGLVLSFFSRKIKMFTPEQFANFSLK